MASQIAENLAEIRKRISSAAIRSGRAADDIKLVAVSKTHPADRLASAITAGATALGENKVQEAEGKITALGRDAAEWHLIGHLQSNKARRAVELFDVIQSVDSPELAARLERNCIEHGRERLSIYVQVDLAGEATKSGVPEADLGGLIELMRSFERVSFDGLMVLPPFFDDPDAARPYFKRLREIRDRIAGSGQIKDWRGELSMGMSHDFEAAIEEGATVVRVGTAIFGERERL